MKEKLNLTIHPEIRAVAEQIAQRRRRSLSQLFEDLIEAEWASGAINTPSIVAATSASETSLPRVKRRRGRTP